MRKSFDLVTGYGPNMTEGRRPLLVILHHCNTHVSMHHANTYRSMLSSCAQNLLGHLATMSSLPCMLPCTPRPFSDAFQKLDELAAAWAAGKWLLRIVFLETVAGVPGMVAGMLRHMRSLRRMERDRGWIHTLLEEACAPLKPLTAPLKTLSCTVLALGTLELHHEPPHIPASDCPSKPLNCTVNPSLEHPQHAQQGLLSILSFILPEPAAAPCERAGRACARRRRTSACTC
jgi:hypothetical protein